MPENDQQPTSICMDYYHGNNGNYFIVGTEKPVQILVFDSRKEGQASQLQQAAGNDSVVQTIGFEEAGNKAGQFNGVCGVCVDEYGRLLTTDRLNDRVHIY